MAATFTPEYEVTEVEVTPADGRRRKITKFALAGVAVLGIGAALTSAAWTDDVFFSGRAESGGIELSGSTNNVDFYDGDTEGNLDLIIADFVVGPNSSDTHRVYVQNEGELPLRLVIVDASGSGDLFPAAPGESASVSAVSNDADGILNPGQTASIDVTVTGNANWEGSEMQLSDGTVRLHVQGTTDLTGP